MLKTMEEHFIHMSKQASIIPSACFHSLPYPGKAAHKAQLSIFLIYLLLWRGWTGIR
jgi:hypothetical protein